MINLYRLLWVGEETDVQAEARFEHERNERKRLRKLDANLIRTVLHKLPVFLGSVLCALGAMILCIPIFLVLGWAVSAVAALVSAPAWAWLFFFLLYNNKK